MYADDTLIVCKADDINSVTNQAQAALNQMFNWCTAYRLSMNLSKTKYLTVKHVKTDLKPRICINNKEIVTVNNYQYLRMILDDMLTMKKANAKVGMLSKIRRFISVKTALNIN